MSTLRISSLFLIDEEALKEDDHLIVSCILDDKINIFRSIALLDLDATGFAFIDEEFARCHSLPLYKLKESRNLEIIDGRSSQSRPITHITKLRLIIDKHDEELSLFVIKLSHYLIVLEKP